jgi:hypothetical protein
MKPTPTTIFLIIILLLTLTNTLAIIHILQQPAPDVNQLYERLHGETQMNNRMIWQLWLRLRNVTGYNP